MKSLLHIAFIFVCFSSFSQEKDLHYFIETAQKNSPLLIDYKNQIQSTTLDSLLNLATRKPQVNGNLLTNYAPIISNYGYDTTLSNAHTVSGLVGVNQKIVGQKYVNSQLQSFKLIKDGLVLNKKIAIKDLNKTVTAQYITASTSLEQMVNNQKMLALLKEESNILKKLTQNSVYKQTDYLIFSATVKQQELVCLQFKLQFQNDLGLLNYLVGETDTTFVRLPKPVISLRILASTDKSIFFKTFENDSIKIQNQNKLIDFAYKPTISLLADAGYLSALNYQPYKNFGFSVGFGVTIPIYDGNQRSLQHQKTSASLATIFAYKTNYKKHYLQQLLILNQKLKQVSQIETQLQSQLSVTETLIEAHKKLLLTGDAQITDFVIAIGSIINIQNSISQNQINKLELINEINYWSFND